MISVLNIHHRNKQYCISQHMLNLGTKLSSLPFIAKYPFSSLGRKDAHDQMRSNISSLHNGASTQSQFSAKHTPHSLEDQQLSARVMSYAVYEENPKVNFINKNHLTNYMISPIRMQPRSSSAVALAPFGWYQQVSWLQ